MQVLELFSKYRWYLIPIIFLSVIIISLYLYSQNVDIQRKNNPVEQVLGSNDKNEEKVSECKLFVEISGAVNRPNVYCFPEGSLVIDGLKRAGGYIKNKNASEYIRANINLARPLVANEKVYFPYRNELGYTPMKYELVQVAKESEKQEEESKCISLNGGSAEELDSLSGVGPSTAAKIIENRPYKKLEDLKNVSGIGDSLFDKIQNKICL